MYVKPRGHFQIEILLTTPYIVALLCQPNPLVHNDASNLRYILSIGSTIPEIHEQQIYENLPNLLLLASVNNQTREHGAV